MRVRRTLLAIIDVNLVLIVNESSTNDIVAITAQAAGLPSDAIDHLPNVVDKIERLGADGDEGGGAVLSSPLTA